MAATAELIQATNRELRWLNAELMDLQDVLVDWGHLSISERQGWDLEWRSSLAVLDALKIRYRDNALTPAQLQAYSEMLRLLESMVSTIEAAGLPVP